MYEIFWVAQSCIFMGWTASWATPSRRSHVLWAGWPVDGHRMLGSMEAVCLIWSSERKNLSQLSFGVQTHPLGLGFTQRDWVERGARI